MSLCACPVLPSEEQKALVQEFLKSDLTEWNLLSLQDMYNAGNSLEDITQVVPFRGAHCGRSLRCCGLCTRQCYHRCIQDCLNRLYMWRKMVESAPEIEVPLCIKLAVHQRFETLEDMSWVVGDIVSRNSNTVIRNYMDSLQLRQAEHPYKLDYAPQVAVNPETGKRVVDKQTGELLVLEWPTTGLCPFCKPKTTIDRRFRKC